MPTDREIEELVARCVAAMVYLSGRRVERTVTLGEIRNIAATVGAWGLSGPSVRERLLRPVEAELVARYGPVNGARLNREFLRAFEA